jgi:hypothetical protein
MYLAIISSALLYMWTLPMVFGYEAVIYVIPKAEINLNEYYLKTENRFTAVYIESGADTGFCVLREKGITVNM